MSIEQDALGLLHTASAHPLPREEIVTRLGAALQRNLNYLAYRARRHRQTAYDEVLEQEIEAIASALLYLQQPPPSEARCIDCKAAPRHLDSARCADCQRFADEHWEQFQQHCMHAHGN